MLYDPHGRQIKRSIGFIPEYRVTAVSEISNSGTADAQSYISFEAEDVYEDSSTVTPENYLFIRTTCISIPPYVIMDL